jgi:hypothetical protein
MPSVRHRDATIYYDGFAQGFPILTFAPAGLQSTIESGVGRPRPSNPITEFTENFRVIAMDQRNAGGQSGAPIAARDGWPDLHGRSHRPPGPLADRPVLISTASVSAARSS